jgi:hypothetical protein
MDIRKVGTQASAKGPAEWFTGTVRIDPLFQAPDPALVQGASVTFEPGARTAWHTIHSVRLSSSRLVAGGHSAKAGPSRKSVPVTWSGSRLVRSTGMVPRQRLP